MRYSFSGSIDVVSNKYGYEYIRTMSIKQGLLPVIFGLIYYLTSFDTVFLWYNFLCCFAVAATMFIMQCIFGEKFPNAINVLFLWVYTFIFMEEYLLSVYYLFSNIVSITDIDKLLLLIDAVASVILNVNLIIVIVNLIRSFRHEAIRNTTRSCELKLYDDKLSGVAMNIRKALVNFEYNYDAIQEVYTLDEESKSKHLCNFVIVPKEGDKLYLCLSGNITAREEVRYILKEIRRGENPYPKKACTQCGFYLIDGRCPNCTRLAAN